MGPDSRNPFQWSPSTRKDAGRVGSVVQHGSSQTGCPGEVGRQAPEDATGSLIPEMGMMYIWSTGGTCRPWVQVPPLPPILQNQQVSSVCLAQYTDYGGDIGRKFRALTLLVGSVRGGTKYWRLPPDQWRDVLGSRLVLLCHWEWTSC